MASYTHHHARVNHTNHETRETRELMRNAGRISPLAQAGFGKHSFVLN